MKADPGGDPAELMRMHHLLLAAVRTGVLHPDLVAFYARTLGDAPATAEAALREVVAGLREFRDARRAIEEGREA